MRIAVPIAVPAVELLLRVTGHDVPIALLSQSQSGSLILLPRNT